MKRMRKIIFGFVAGISLMAAGAALAALLIHIGGSGSVTGKAPSIDVIVSSVGASGPCTAAKTGPTAFSITMTEVGAGDVCGVVLTLTNNGSANAWAHAATLSGPAAVYLTAASPASLSLPLGGGSDGYTLNLTAGAVPVGYSDSFSVDIVADNVP